MKAVVDVDKCTGCGLCCDTCPHVFEMDDAVAKVIATPVELEDEKCCRQAADGCPVEAIAVTE